MTTLGTPNRYRRLNGPDRRDQRTESQHDRDRLLYCSAFRRLAEVTQVVSAAEGHSFHNRLTHTLKVAQIARRLAEKLQGQQQQEARMLEGPDPEVAESAALAHDLGHPPFGHVAEEELNQLTAGSGDGFEGNAQSFRIITKLAVRSDRYAGLNLTAATLNGVLKYPWGRDPLKKKWGVYRSELDVFDWARKALGMPREMRSVEAELMDWADDIAYSVYDVDDFYRAGLIPLGRLFADSAERDRFLENATQRLASQLKDPAPITDAFRELVISFPPVTIGGDFKGSIEQRAFLREWTGRLVTRYINAITLIIPKRATDKTVVIEPALKYEVESLKQLVWYYVIENPRLLTQQHGQRAIIRNLFAMFREKAEAKKFDFFPEPYRQMLTRSAATRDYSYEHIRIVCDMICAMTETQALRMHQRLSGMAIGSIHDQL